MSRFVHLQDRLSGLNLHLDEQPMLRAVRRALVLAIPFLLIGSFALVLISLPMPGYQRWMARAWGPGWKGLGLSAIGGTVGMLSPAMVLLVSYCYAQERNETGRAYVNPIIAALVSLGSLLCLSGIGRDSFSIASFGVTGLFAAILVALVSVRVFLGLAGIRRLRIQVFSDGANAAFNDAMDLAVPALATVGLAAAAGCALLRIGGAGTIQELLARPLLLVFRPLGDSFAGGLLYALLVHLFWAFGIHGGMVLEPVAQEIFTPAVLANQHLVALHLAPAHIFSKTFFDVFVLMGGCGTSLSLVLAILLAGRQKNLRRHVGLSLLPVAFNINELIVFGVPIVLNPAYLIPFLGTPLLLTLVAYGATAAGLVPYAVHPVEWTTPILLGGYTATGSLAGSILQVVNLGIGLACYLPFVRIAEHQSTERVKRILVRIGERIEAPMPDPGGWGLLSRHDDLGLAARSLAVDLRHDLEQGRLELHYQPQCNQRGEVSGIEALLRWPHRTYGFIPPPVAIALAQESRLMGRLDRWILDTACRQLRSLIDLGFTDLVLSFNTTARRLESGQVHDDLEAALAAYQLPPRQLKVELTEQEALSAPHSAVQRMNEIRDLGVQLAMDDFGMGHTSILYLKECIFDTVKIDGSLVTGLEDTPACSQIIRTIVKLGESLGFSVIAEFVETRAQLDQLVDLGCREFQGYFYARALPAPALVAFLQGREREAAGAPAPR